MYWMQIRSIKLNYVFSFFIKIKINLFIPFITKYWFDYNVRSRRPLWYLVSVKFNGPRRNDFIIYEKRRLVRWTWWTISLVKTYWVRLWVLNNKKLPSRLLRLKNIDIQNIPKKKWNVELKNVIAQYKPWIEK